MIMKKNEISVVVLLVFSAVMLISTSCTLNGRKVMTQVLAI